MAKTKVSEWSTTPSSNTDIDGINIAEGCAPSGINDAIRDLMAQIRSWQSGTYGDTFNGPVNGTVGATIPATGAFTTLSASSTVTLSGGTANGVTYLNGSKVLTSGSALTFDGTNFSVGGNADPFGRFYTRSVGITSSGSSVLEINGTSYGGIDLGSAGTRYFSLTGNSTDAIIGTLNGAVPLEFQINGSEQMRLTSTGLGIGTSSPAHKLDVNGAIGIGGTKFFSKITGDSYIWNNTSALNFVSSDGNTVQMKLDSSGNLGLGVTPKTWGSYFKALQMGDYAAFANNVQDASAIVSSNAYNNDNTNWRYSFSSVAASRYEVSAGAFRWFNAPSGTAGTAITFTQVATIDANGRWLLGTTTGVGSDFTSIRFNSGGSYPQGMNMVDSNASASGSVFQVFRKSDDTYLGNIRRSGTDNAIYVGGNSYLALGSGDTERARIDSSGNLLVGTTSYSGSTNGNYLMSGASDGTHWVSHASGTSSGKAYVNFQYNGTNIGSITQTGTTAVLYNTTSDQRLKENIQDADSASSLIDSLQVRKFDWKADGSHQRYGFVAQELVTVAPEAVHQPEDTEQMMAVDYSKLVPMLVKEIQSLRVRVAQLESN